jgi:hypothetical protein
MSGAHEGTPLSDDEEKALAKVRSRKRRKHVRVITTAPAGSDPHPTKEPARNSGTENDARLKADKPPHY